MSIDIDYDNQQSQDIQPTEWSIMGLWTITHLYQILPTFLIFTVISVFAARSLGKCKTETRYLPLKVIVVILLILEVMKQINAAGAEGGYNLYALPFHYCSLFLYLLPFHAFYRGRYRHLTDSAAFACLASLVLDMILMPAVIFTETNLKNCFVHFADFHTVVFHNLVVLYFMLTVALKLYELNTRRDIKVMSVFLSIYVVIAAILSYSLKVNFHNLYRCNIGFLETVRASVVDALGVFGTLIYVSALLVLTILFGFLAYFLARLLITTIKSRN